MQALIVVLILVGLGLDTTHIQASEFTKDELKTIAVGIAHEHGLNVDKFLKTIECESGWDAVAEGDYPDGKGGFTTKAKAPKGSKPTSFGLVQLHYPERDWGVTIAQAKEPIRALQIMANAWDKYGVAGAPKWTCYRAL